MTHEHTLRGCRSRPLAHYLKAIGILRLVSEQVDPGARGHWSGDSFVLRTTLDEAELARFFLEDYAPTPILAPWNGGSGFYPKDNQTGAQSLARSECERFHLLRDSILIAQALISELGLTERPEGAAKDRFIEQFRSTWPEAAVAWLDAAIVLTGSGAKYPPLLGTGGNDGRLDFTNNFMQRIVELFDGSTGQATGSTKALLELSLFGDPAPGLQGGAIGFFHPGATGGPNAGTGYEGSPGQNPWDFVLMLEGALMFASAAVRRLGSAGTAQAAYPFWMRHSAIGAPSVAAAEEGSSRGELWMPIWSDPTAARELDYVLSEGRVTVGSREARDSVDVAMALGTLGVDRGLNAFERYALQMRNGKAFLAVPLGRFAVRESRASARLLQIDRWLRNARRAASADRTPNAVRSAMRVVERAILAVGRYGDSPTRDLDLLLALGSFQAKLGRSSKWAREKGPEPIPLLKPSWLKGLPWSPELRLAASLASVYDSSPDRDLFTRSIRGYVEPVELRGSKTAWLERPTRQQVWHDADLTKSMCRVMARRLVDADRDGVHTHSDRGVPASDADIADFLAGRVDDALLSAAFRSFLMLDWSDSEARSAVPSAPGQARLPALYALLKLCFPGTEVMDLEIPVAREVHTAAMHGDAFRATRHAVRRLRGAGLVPAIPVIHEPDHATRRAAAALLFPVSRTTLVKLTQTLRPTETEQTNLEAQ